MNIILVLLITALITYLTRLLPVILMDRIAIPRKVSHYLRMMPLAALGALLIPGAAEAVGGNVFAGLSGVLAAGVISYFKPGILLPVVASVAVSFGVLHLSGM